MEDLDIAKIFYSKHILAIKDGNLNSLKVADPILKGID
jgi:hypothetical protein